MPSPSVPRGRSVGWRRIERGTAGREGIDARESQGAAIDEHFLRPSAERAFEPGDRGDELALIGPDVRDPDPADEAARDVGRELAVVGRAVAAVAHPHDPCLGIGRAGPGLGHGASGVRVPALDGLEIGQDLERSSDAGLALCCGALAGGGHPPAGGPRVLVELVAQGRHLGAETASASRPAAMRG